MVNSNANGYKKKKVILSTEVPNTKHMYKEAQTSQSQTSWGQETGKVSNTDEIQRGHKHRLNEGAMQGINHY